MLNIFTMPIFERKLKHYAKKNPNIKKDYQLLLDTIEDNPINAIPIKDGVYKLRLKNTSSNRGKSSGYRVYYYYKDVNDTVILLYIYSKKEQSNLSDERLNEIIGDCKILFKENFF